MNSPGYITAPRERGWLDTLCPAETVQIELRFKVNINKPMVSLMTGLTASLKHCKSEVKAWNLCCKRCARNGTVSLPSNIQKPRVFPVV
jgi:hypothetical protein